MSRPRKSWEPVYRFGSTKEQQLAEALRPFAALLQEGEVGSHDASQPDGQPVFAINRAQITLGDLRRAAALLGEK